LIFGKLSWFFAAMINKIKPFSHSLLHKSLPLASCPTPDRLFFVTELTSGRYSPDK